MILRRFRFLILGLIFLLQYLFVSWCAHHPERVENFYSKGFYAHSLGIRLTLLQKIPFSVGDLLYTLVLGWALYCVFQWRKANIKKLILHSLFALNLVYFVFHLSWGLNYHRLPLAKQLGYSSGYTIEELEESLCFYLNQSNSLQAALGFPPEQRVETTMSLNELKSLVQDTHASSPLLYTKNSHFSTLLSYMGYAGYLNPFTLESQINDKLPKINVVVTMAHEISHQKGYAAENEANFMGFLFCQEHPNLYIRYASALFSVRYLYSDLYKADPEKAKRILREANTGILLNINEASAFWKKHKNPLAPYFQQSYNHYLKANRQARGIRSYNDVVGLIIQYHKESLGIE